VAKGTPRSSLVFTCEGCGVPFLAESILPHGERRCAPCGAGLVPPELPDREVAIAAENEVRAALATRWRFVTSSAAQPYLDRIARQVATRIDGAPAQPRVVLVEAAEHRTLALPSGTLLVSTGLLAFLEDEAELAFVLGHEIAHAASGEAAVRLVRLGFEATARERSATDGLCWSDAAVDLARLGYGRKRERDADQCALSTMLDLEYEPLSACRYLQRLHAAIARGDDVVSETDVAHPTPFDRLRRIERALGARVGATTEVPRVNREVFRRALTPATLSAALVRTDLDAPQPLPWGMTGLLEKKPGVLSVPILVGLALALTALVVWATWLLR
jgi:predicted Zn-dependent protease